MNDKEIMLCLRRLKDEGINFKYISEQCGIPTNKFYNFTYKRSFPFYEKQLIETYLITHFKDIVLDECMQCGRRN